jgi:hypothetical protein
VLGENFLPRRKLGEGEEAQRVAWLEPTYCHGGVWSDYGLRRRGDQGRKDENLIMVETYDVGYGSRRRTTNLSRSLCNAIYDSTPSLGAELLRGLDAVIRDVDVEDDHEDVRKQRQDESERIT